MQHSDLSRFVKETVAAHPGWRNRVLAALETFYKGTLEDALDVCQSDLSFRFDLVRAVVKISMAPGVVFRDEDLAGAIDRGLTELILLRLAESRELEVVGASPRGRLMFRRPT